MKIQNSKASAIEQVRAFLTTNSFYAGAIPADLADDFPLLDSGALDSLGVFNLVNFIEQSFEIRVEVEDLSRGSFGSLKEIGSFVDHKLQAAREPARV